MNDVKAQLIVRYDSRCMICGENVGRLIEKHHLKPRYAFKREGKPVDESIHNNVLLCPFHHKVIHLYDYNDKEYQELTRIILFTRELWDEQIEKKK